MFANLLKKVKKLLKKIYNSLVQFILFNFFKIDEKKIVFDNFNGKGYGCNPKYIAEELIRQNINCDMVWLVEDFAEEMPSQIRKAKYGSLKSMYELATARLWIDNVRNYKGIPKREGQFYIQTWHAGLGLKKVEKDIEKSLSPEYVKDAKNDGKITDLMLSNCKFITDLYRKSYWYEGEVLEEGFPRNDILINIPKHVKEKVYKYFDINDEKSLVIYAPTFRKNLDMDVYKFSYQKCIAELNKKFCKQYIMLIRLHPNIAQYNNLISYSDNVLDATNYPDIQELLAACEVGITDYSSIMFDLSMIGKKVFLFGKDLDIFKEKERDLEFQIEELPFPFAKSEEELFSNISNFSEEDYEIKCKKFYDKLGAINPPNASEKVVDIIKTKIKGA